LSSKNSGMELTTDGAYSAHPTPSIILMAVIEKSETGRRAYWCDANCGKIAEGRRLFRNLGINQSVWPWPGRRGPKLFPMPL
jgi:hypothetical protein